MYFKSAKINQIIKATIKPDGEYQFVKCFEQRIWYRF